MHKKSSGWLKIYPHNFIWLALAVLTVILDQITKHIALSKLIFEGNTVNVLPVFSWTLAYNPGAAFSFLSDAGGWQRYFFTSLAGIVSLLFVCWLLRMPKRLKVLPAAIALILGGAIGNLIDRLTTQLVNWQGEQVHGVVIDFLHVHYGTWHFPIFNLADCAITLGTILLLIDTFFLEKKRQQVTH
ncbi:lipoprotein signal peptidase [Acinetobacter qingfengensis]|uniref:Lipoprotein signal peptidase n=1 Tax=Acinetobacter qingfengensis TaxID=1262585 RepID=A0A1E7QWP3_9GAMM|nr:signal peptidase II [Acinetobacter qingfengensis]KAA8731245.1 lipoprotein signal peptidase [Acinetobacter qingfengensis]OEY91507.1 signal peptidase II [Acinetobacter qingfengensis]